MHKLLVAASVLFVACGQGSASVTGTASGVKLVPASAFGVLSYTAGSVDTSGSEPAMIPAQWLLGVTISNKQNVCEELTHRNQQPNEIGLLLRFTRKDGDGIAPGTFTVTPAGEGDAVTGVTARATLYKDNSSCRETLSNDEKFATSGTVTLTHVSKDELDGTFELTFASGSMKGSFIAPMCRDFIIQEVSANFTCLP